MFSDGWRMLILDYRVVNDCEKFWKEQALIKVYSDMIAPSRTLDDDLKMVSWISVD